MSSKAEKIRKLRRLAASERKIGNPEAAKTAERVANELEAQLGSAVRPDRPKSEAIHESDDFRQAAEGFRSATGGGHGFSSATGFWDEMFGDAFGGKAPPKRDWKKSHNTHRTHRAEPNPGRSAAEAYQQAEEKRKKREAEEKERFKEMNETAERIAREREAREGRQRARARNHTTGKAYGHEQWEKQARESWERDEAEKKAGREREKERRASEQSAEAAYASSFDQQHAESVFRKEWFKTDYKPTKDDPETRARQKAESDAETKRRRKEQAEWDRKEAERNRAATEKKEKERHRRKVGLRRGNVVRYDSTGGVVVRTWWNEDTDVQHCYVALDNGAQTPWIVEILRSKLKKISD